MGMEKRGIQESNFTFRKDSAYKSGAHKKRMPLIKCVCGFEILVVPDLKAMNRAIKNHIAKHNKASSERLENFLTKQALILASNRA